ncbi:hypothetical protein BDV38DRAFT_290007 [Aspergillus pseudotamarii]|uniref:Uncharacterized protein n=1 Tax=Aspergillus pseudotamarii TaxID=132259 RepID=A0A5N6SA89_ASPPS|nr:uncharacterized protein BDV38DRAFT_290007 [Aspergillus pseudotamarii]KAE8131636.1 hypothetical protein BDV38DRAFT_290007 [Aspergillus pseudotamarii]
MATPTYALSVNIYGRGDATLGDGPSHMGIAMYKIGSPTCSMHHIRNPNDRDFIYDPRTQPLEDDPVLRGRCELTTFTTAAQKDHAEQLLFNFGRNDANIPEFGMLEKEGVVSSGEGLFWEEMINLSADAMQDRCEWTGRTWVPGLERVFEGEADARFVDKGGLRPVGRLRQNSVLRERMLALEGSFPTKESRRIEEDLSGERPFYVSSPFFSRTGKIPEREGDGTSDSADAAEGSSPSTN